MTLSSPYAQPAHWLHTARFVISAAQLPQLPSSNLPEIAFVGRSNAGKSSSINALTQQTRLAFASKMPGRTQHINLFALGPQEIPDAMLADLPGYGYAAVGKFDKWRWQQMMGQYLVSRPNLVGVVLLCDPRHGLTDLDDMLLELLLPRVEAGLKLLVLLTKVDKLNRSQAQKALQITKLRTHGAQAMLFSSLRKTGLEAAQALLRQWIDQASMEPASSNPDSP